jgi:hypothetical protein
MKSSFSKTNNGFKEIYSSYRADEYSFAKVFTNLTVTVNNISKLLYNELNTNKQKQEFIDKFEWDKVFDEPLYNYQVSQLDSIDSLREELLDNGISFDSKPFSNNQLVQEDQLCRKENVETKRKLLISKFKFNKSTNRGRFENLERENSSKTGRALLTTTDEKRAKKEKCCFTQHWSYFALD